MSTASGPDDIAGWLDGLGLGRYAEAFDANDIDARVLPSLTGDDLKEMGIASVGHRRRLLEAIAALAVVADGVARAPHPVDTAPAERRQVTVLFCDLVGSTRLSSELDPEDMRGLMRSYQDAVSRAVTGQGGHVANYLGDGVVVYFGWPRAYEDQAARAARAGLAAVRAVAALETPAGASLAARVGIATGRVVVGDLAGEASHQVGAVVGETPNLAARLQGVAEPGEVIVDEITCQLLAGAFALDDMGRHALKGLPQPVQAWRLGSETGGDTRSAASGDGRASPFVGRDSEMALLQARWKQAKAGEGRVVLLSGEAGIGKSRLAQALRARIRNEPHTRLGLQCAPQHSDSMLHPVIGHLQRAAGFAREDSGDQKLAKLEAVLAETARPGPQTAALLGALLGLPIAGRYPALEMSAQRQLEDTLSALVEQTVALSAQAPALVVADDLHWADPVSLDLIGRLIAMAADHPILMLLVFRDEFAPPWPGHGHVTSLTLDRLVRSDGERIIKRVAGGAPLPGELVDRIVEQTDGVPLFVEELTRSVLESDIVQRSGDRYAMSGRLEDMVVPATLQDSLTARLDRLGPAREVAQTAACIGRRFAHELLAAILPLDEAALAAAIEQLVDLQLVFRRGTPPEATYEFKHALVRDAAYQGLLRSRRSEIHHAIAEAMESRHPDVADSAPELLAHHFGLAGEPGKAAQFRLAAARRLLRSSALAESTRQSEIGLGVVEFVEDPPLRRRLELELLVTLATANAWLKGFPVPEVVSTLARAEAMCDPDADADMLFRILAVSGTAHIVAPDLLVVLDVSRRLLELGERTGRKEAVFVAHAMFAIPHWMMGNDKQAETGFAAAVDLMPVVVVSELLSDTGWDWRGFMLSFKAFMHAQRGEFAQAQGTSDKSLELACESEHPANRAGILMLRSAVLRWVGDLQGSADAGSEALAYSDEQLLAQLAPQIRVFLGQTLVSMGRVEDGAALIAEGNAGMREIGSDTSLGTRLCYEAAVVAHTGDTETARSLVAKAKGAMERTKERWSGPLADIFEANVEAAAGNTAVAEDAYRRAIDRTERNGWFGQQLAAALGYARFLMASGRHTEARTLLAHSLDRIADGHDCPIVLAAQGLLKETA